MESETQKFIKVTGTKKPGNTTLRIVRGEGGEPEVPTTIETSVQPEATNLNESSDQYILKKEEEKTMMNRDARFPAAIKVIGVGGGGCNAVRRMLKQQVPGIEYIIANTDVKSLGVDSDKVLSIQIGEHLTRGLGAGGNARVGERAAEEGRFVLKKAVKDAELIFITAGMGGGTGTGAAPVVAQIAKESKALVIAVVTTPFSFEGKKRFSIALGGIRRLRQEVDNLIVIHNDRLLQFTEHNAPVQQAFRVADEALSEGVLSISQLVNVPGEINVDLADVKTIMAIPGGALMAIGRGDGARYPALEAADQAISNPLLDINLKGAKGLLFNFQGGPDLTLGEVNDAANHIAEEVDPECIIFFGMTAPTEELRGTVKLTLVATGIRPALPTNWLSEMGETIKEAIMGHRR